MLVDLGGKCIGGVPAAERESGLLDLILARPLPRTRYLLAVLLLLVLGALLVLAVYLAHRLARASESAPPVRQYLSRLVPYAVLLAALPAVLCAALSAALGRIVAWFEEDAWLAGPEPSLADAVFVPFLVREEALRGLGFVDPVPAAITEYGARVRAGRGWPAVAWTRDQTDEIVGRFTNARPLGIARPDGHFLLNPPAESTLADGDRLVVIAQDLERIEVADAAVRLVRGGPAELDAAEVEEHILVVGWNQSGPQLISGWAAATSPASTVEVAYDPSMIGADDIRIPDLGIDVRLAPTPETSSIIRERPPTTIVAPAPGSVVTSGSPARWMMNVDEAIGSASCAATPTAEPAKRPSARMEVMVVLSLTIPLPSSMGRDIQHRALLSAQGCAAAEGFRLHGTPRSPTTRGHSTSSRREVVPTCHSRLSRRGYEVWGR